MQRRKTTFICRMVVVTVGAPNYWVLRTLGSLFSAPTEEHGFLRVTEYGVGADARLRPLRAVPKTFDDSIELNIPA